MKKIKIYTVDAFTDEMFKGNPAGVVVLDEILQDEKMQLIAKEMNLSETAFLTKSNSPDVDYRIRYFTPGSEVDFCGHATIGSAWILGTIYQYVDIKDALILETNVGIVSVTWSKQDGKLHSVMMRQVAPQVKGYDEDINELLNCLHISVDDIDTRYPISYAYTGIWHLIVPIKTKEKVMEISPDFNKLSIHNKARGIITTHLFTFDTPSKDALLYTRDFAPAVGVNEDPVTGSANGALSGYLVLNNLVHKEGEFLIFQDNKFDRLGKLLIRTSIVNHKISIEVGGSAVVVLDGEITL